MKDDLITNVTALTCVLTSLKLQAAQMRWRMTNNFWDTLHTKWMGNATGILLCQNKDYPLGQTEHIDVEIKNF